MVQLDTCQCRFGTGKAFKAQHRSSDFLDEAMVGMPQHLLDDIVQVLTFENHNRPCEETQSCQLHIDSVDARHIGAAFIDRYLPWYTGMPDGLSEELRSCRLVVLFGQHEINGVAEFIDHSIQVNPLAL